MVPVMLQRPALLRQVQGDPGAAAEAKPSPNAPACIPPKLAHPVLGYSCGNKPQAAFSSPQEGRPTGGSIDARVSQRSDLRNPLYFTQKQIYQQHLQQQHLQPKKQLLFQRLGFDAMLSRFKNITPCSAAESAALSRSCSRIYCLVPPKTAINLPERQPLCLARPSSPLPAKVPALLDAQQPQCTTSEAEAAAPPAAATEALKPASGDIQVMLQHHAASLCASQQRRQVENRWAAPLHQQQQQQQLNQLLQGGPEHQDLQLIQMQRQFQQQQQLHLHVEEELPQPEVQLQKLHQQFQQQHHLQDLKMQQKQQHQQLELERQKLHLLQGMRPQQQQQPLQKVELQKQLQQREQTLKMRQQHELILHGQRHLFQNRGHVETCSNTPQAQQPQELQEELQPDLQHGSQQELLQQPQHEQDRQQAMKQQQKQVDQNEEYLHQQQQQNQAASEDSTEQQRLAAELQLVEQQLADKEALLALFEGASEQQQQLQRALQLQQLQQQNQQLQRQQLQNQQLLQLIEQQKQELAKQQQQVGEQQREVEKGLLLLQQQQETLNAQQQQQQAAAEAQQKQQQWLEEQQEAVQKAQDDLAVGRMVQQKQQQQLSELREQLQRQEADLAEKRERHRQQQQQLLQQQADMQASLRAQGVQLLHQHQALQRQLQQQRELQQQILDYQRQQLVDTQDALQQQQQQQPQHHLFDSASLRRRVTREAGIEPMLQQVQQQLLLQQRQQQQLQEELLQHLKQQQSAEETDHKARWCRCDTRNPLPSCRGPDSMAAPLEDQRDSAGSTRLPSAESIGKLGGLVEPGSSSRDTQRGPPRNHPKSSLRWSNRGPLECPPSAPSKSHFDQTLIAGLSQEGPSTGTIQGRNGRALGVEPWGSSLGAPLGPQGRKGVSTCPPRLLRSTESQRLREVSLQKHIKALNEVKRSGAPREGLKRGPTEHSRLPSAESEHSDLSTTRSKSNSWRAHHHLATRGTAYHGGARIAVQGESHNAPPPGAPVNPQGTRQQQQQLQQLLQEQRREINLLLLEKQQLERAATSGGGTIGGPLTPRGPMRTRAFPKEPYVQGSANCAEADGGPRGCVCGGDHPRTAWGPLDAALAEVHNSHEGLQRWTKVNEGVYFYGDTQVSLSFINGRLMAQTDGGPLSWNKGARGDILKFIRAADERRAQANG